MYDYRREVDLHIQNNKTKTYLVLGNKEDNTHRPESRFQTRIFINPGGHGGLGKTSLRLFHKHVARRLHSPRRR